LFYIDGDIKRYLKELIQKKKILLKTYFFYIFFNDRTIRFRMSCISLHLTQPNLLIYLIVCPGDVERRNYLTESEKYLPDGVREVFT
jgi:hypothetical protein